MRRACPPGGRESVLGRAPGGPALRRAASHLAEEQPKEREDVDVGEGLCSFSYALGWGGRGGLGWGRGGGNVGWAGEAE